MNDKTIKVLTVAINCLGWLTIAVTLWLFPLGVWAVVRLEWNAGGPLAPDHYEVWHATELLPGCQETQGTNVPDGFSLFAIVPGNQTALELSPTQANEFFILRAASADGQVSDWSY